MIPHYTTTRIVLSSILLAACLPIGAAESPVIAEATALIQSLQTHFDHRQVDKITELFHPQYEEGELLKENLQKAKELDAFPDYTLTLLDAIEQAAAGSPRRHHRAKRGSRGSPADRAVRAQASRGPTENPGNL